MRVPVENCQKLVFGLLFSEIIQCDGQTDGRKDWMIAITALSRAYMWYKFEINRHILILLVFCIIIFNWKWPK